MGALSGVDSSISVTDVDGVSPAGEQKPLLGRPYPVDFVEADVFSVLVKSGKERCVSCRSRGSSTVGAGTFLISLPSIVNFDPVSQKSRSERAERSVPRKEEAQRSTRKGLRQHVSPEKILEPVQPGK